MSEQSKIFSLAASLYSEGSPVIIKSGELLKDSSGVLVAQLKLQNISPKTVKFIKVEFTLLDTLNRHISPPISFNYFDFSIKRGDSVVSKAPIKNRITRSFTAKVIEVGFVDNTVWSCDEGEWRPLPKQTRISDVFNNSDAICGYKSLFGQKANMKIAEYSDIWFCACGAINHEDEEQCYACKANKNTIQGISEEELAKEGIYAVACQLAESENLKDVTEAKEGFAKIYGYKDSESRIGICEAKAEELREKQAAKAKRIKQNVTISSLIVGGIILFILLAYFVICPWVSFNNGYYRTYIDIYKVTEFEIPEGTTSIRDQAFSRCDSLTKVTIPDSVTSIGHHAFYECNFLTSITIPDNVTSIGDDAFSGCDSLTSVTIPGSVKSIGAWAFQRCANLTTITIPESVTSIGDSAFSGCESLTSVTIPGSVKSIGDSAFYGCDSLTTVTISGQSASIGAWAFSSCQNLTDVIIMDGVESIGEYAFKQCDNLATITIPESVTSIGANAFYGCESLTSVTIPGSVKSIGACAFKWCDNLINVTIMDGVENIGESAFEWCANLTTITIPESVTSIGYDAFYLAGGHLSIYYTGSKNMWNALNVPSRSNITVYYNQ